MSEVVDLAASAAGRRAPTPDPPRLRHIAPLKLPDVTPGGADMPEPKMARARPQDLVVDDDYQRNLSARSMTLIRKMVAAWDWRSFQPPLCVEVGGRYHVVDGQHTAIAAATHPRVDTIPILVVEAGTRELRAGAFIGRNRDRIIVTPNQLHHAAVAAGDPVEVAISRIAAAAGVSVLKNPPGSGGFKEGNTLAIATLRAVLRRRGEGGLRRVLVVCAGARVAPISAALVLAVEWMLFQQQAAARLSDFDLTTLVRGGGRMLDAEGRLYAIKHSLPWWRGIAHVLTHRMGKLARAQ